MRKKCASLISDGQSLLIDSGTTCYYLIQALECKNLRIVATDIKNACELSRQNHHSVYIIGGEIRLNYYSLGSLIAINNLHNFNIQTAIMSADAIDIEHGVTNADIFEVAVKKKIREICNQLVLIVDSSKFNQHTFYHVLDIKEFDLIITDSGIPAQVVEDFKRKKIALTIVETSAERP